MSVSYRRTEEPLSPWPKIFNMLPSEIYKHMSTLPSDFLAGLEEIRLRLSQPIELCGRHGSCFLNVGNGITQRVEDGLITSSTHLSTVVQNITQFSLYAVEEELRRGFITIQGGHRVGVAGRIALDNQGQVKSIRAISSLNIRVARAFPGVASAVKSYVYQRPDGNPLSVLILSPPQCGKTTLLRDLVRGWSQNLLVRRTCPAKVVVVDERSEIAGCIEGVPQFDVGPRTDVLDACPKAEGMLMAIRSLSPDIVVTDEIGRSDDARAILEATHAGVAVIASAHANRLDEWRKRPHMEELFSARAFDRYILLSRKRGPGTVETVLDSTGRPIS